MTKFDIRDIKRAGHYTYNDGSTGLWYELLIDMDLDVKYELISNMWEDNPEYQLYFNIKKGTFQLNTYPPRSPLTYGGDYVISNLCWELGISNTSDKNIYNVPSANFKNYLTLQSLIRNKWSNFDTNVISESYCNNMNNKEYKFNITSNIDTNSDGIVFKTFNNLTFTKTVDKLDNNIDVLGLISGFASSNIIYYNSINFLSLGIDPTKIEQTEGGKLDADLPPDTPPIFENYASDKGYFRRKDSLIGGDNSWGDRKNKLGSLSYDDNTVFLHDGNGWVPAPLTGRMN